VIYSHVPLGKIPDFGGKKLRLEGSHSGVGPASPVVALVSYRWKLILEAQVKSGWIFLGGRRGIRLAPEMGEIYGEGGEAQRMSVGCIFRPGEAHLPLLQELDKLRVKRSESESRGLLLIIRR
jgi:hypothetical protein